MGARESPPLVTEELALQQVLRDSAAVDRDEAAPVPLAVLMDAAGDQFLPRACLAEDQDVRVRDRDAADRVEDGGHARALADDLVEGIRPLDGELQQPVLLTQPLSAEEPSGSQQKVVGKEGLDEVVGGPELHALDRGLDGREGGQDDHRKSGILLAPDLEQLGAADSWHAEVGHQQVEALRLQAFRRSGRVGFEDDLDPRQLSEDVRAGLEHVLLVVGYEHARIRHRPILRSGPARRAGAP